eukprot:3693526-Prymnesium_polylepis.1
MEAMPEDADIDKGDATEYTALMRAAGQGHVQVTIELLKRISNIGKNDNKGVTALMNAARNGYASTMALLLRRSPARQLQSVLDAVRTCRP